MKKQPAPRVCANDGDPDSIMQPQRQRVRQSRSARGSDVVSLPFDAQDPLVSSPPSQHHQLSESNRYPINLASWLDENEGDRAVLVSTVIQEIVFVAWLV